MEPVSKPDCVSTDTAFRCALIIPTYNNEQTLKAVIDSAKIYCDDIVVVDDGSTDSTQNVIREIGGIISLGYSLNKGKGHALRMGMHHVFRLGFTHAITMDADGQHCANDIPALLEASKSQPSALVVGCRTLTATQSHTPPLRSRIGKFFGAFWFTFITGKKLSDTQSGFRVYPLALVEGCGCCSDRYEYEQELLIALLWQGIPLVTVPVQKKYFSKEESRSHFRPFVDFIRIFMINSRAAFQRCVLPKELWSMRKEPLLKVIQRVFEHELASNASPKRAAFSLSLGTFFAILPIPFFQVLSLIGLSFFIRINRPLAFIGVSISSAPLVPFWVALGVMVGLPFANMVSAITPLTKYWHYGVAWFIGSCIVAVFVGVVTAAISFPVFTAWHKKKNAT